MLPRKQKFCKRIKKIHFNRNLRRQMMTRSRLKNKANKSKILVTLSNLSDNLVEICINKANCSTLRKLMLIVITNHFEKNVNCTSQIKQQYTRK